MAKKIRKAYSIFSWGLENQAGEDVPLEQTVTSPGITTMHSCPPRVSGSAPAANPSAISRRHQAALRLPWAGRGGMLSCHIAALACSMIPCTPSMARHQDHVPGL